MRRRIISIDGREVNDDVLNVKVMYESRKKHIG